MGWKLSSVIINTTTDIGYKELLENLGYKNLEKIENKPYDAAMFPGKNEIYIGSYNNITIISGDDLPIDFFTDSLSNTEKRFISSFPNSEICAVSLQSVINHFGFALLKNGEKIRVKAGDGDLGTIIDIGQPLEQELELLSKSRINEKGQRLYYFDDNEDSPYKEDQVGENFIFEIFKLYTGKTLDANDDLLDTEFEGYTFSKEVSHDEYFSGEWEGQYTYGNGYPESVKGKSEQFVIKLRLVNGAIQGICTDANKPPEEAGSIEGFLSYTFIAFIKKYPVRYFLDENGNAKKDETRKPSNLEYAGLYDPLTDSFKGIWRIENKNNWGEWSMKRVP